MFFGLFDFLRCLTLDWKKIGKSVGGEWKDSLRGVKVSSSSKFDFWRRVGFDLLIRAFLIWLNPRMVECRFGVPMANSSYQYAQQIQSSEQISQRESESTRWPSPASSNIFPEKILKGPTCKNSRTPNPILGNSCRNWHLGKKWTKKKKRQKVPKQ